MDNEKLQSGWKHKRLDEVCKVVNGGTPKTKVEEYWGGEHFWVTPAEMGKRETLFISETTRTLTEIGIQNTSAQLVPPLSVILSTRAPIGHLVVNTEPMAFNQGCRGLVPNDGLDYKFLYYFLLGNVDLLNNLGTGATFKELSATKLKCVNIPLPPLPEQKRIVAILDEAFAGISLAVANAEKNLANARELFESYLNNVFTQKGDGWEEKSVGDIAEHRLGKMLDKQKNKGVFKPYLRNLNVRWFKIELGDLLEMRFEQAEEERYSVKKGDLLICEGGYPGRAAIWEDGETIIFFQKALHRVRSKEPLHNRWMLYFLYLSDVTGDIQQYYTGAGIQHFTGQSLKRFYIPIPPIEEISLHLKQFDFLFEETIRLETIYQQKLTALNELKQSILQKAFTGELTQREENV